ncbi:hypothetical protein Tco_1141674 [Tanacetum coccineum]
MVNPVPRYMSFFLDQKIAETRRFVTRMREEADTIRGSIAQMTALVAELQAMENVGSMIIHTNLNNDV